MREKASELKFPVVSTTLTPEQGQAPIWNGQQAYHWSRAANGFANTPVFTAALKITSLGQKLVFSLSFGLSNIAVCSPLSNQTGVTNFSHVLLDFISFLAIDYWRGRVKCNTQMAISVKRQCHQRWFFESGPTSQVKFRNNMIPRLMLDLNFSQQESNKREILRNRGGN